MRRKYWQLLIFVLSVTVGQAVHGQASAGSFVVTGRAKTATKTVPLKKKRFYLFRGGREANATLIGRLKAADVLSRDCFYCRQKASPQFMEWLKAGDGNCDSAYCREITQDAITKVPEFQAAFQRGTKPFADKPDLARKWLMTNLEPGLRTGFYDARKSMIDGLLKDLPDERLPVQSSMTDNSPGPSATFSNIRLAKDVEKFTFANLVPFEYGDKSYVWICEIDVGKDKKTPVLDAPESSKVIRKCEVIVRDLPKCVAGACEQE
jgi:hypothetical protein